MLEGSQIDVWYGKNHVLHEVSFEVAPGEVVALVGPNSAGKTTVMRSLMGLKDLRTGRIRLAGEDITHNSTVSRVRAGLVLVPEGRQVFPRLSVTGNLAMGAYHRKDRDRVGEEVEDIYQLFPRLRERRHQKAGSMSGGEQQMLALARGLLSRPRCLLLDEPMLGLAPVVTREIAAAIRHLSERGMSMLLAEQNTALAVQLAARTYVLEVGRISGSGPKAPLRSSENVRHRHLGI